MKRDDVFPGTRTSMTENDYHDARTMEGLREAKRDEGITVAEARQRMEALIDNSAPKP